MLDNIVWGTLGWLADVIIWGDGLVKYMFGGN